MKFQLWLCACLLAACSGESDPGADAGPVGDAGQTDSSVVDSGSTDTGSTQDMGPVDSGDPNSFVLTVQISGAGLGRVQDTPNNVDCASADAPCTYTLPVGTLLTLTPTANPASTFSNWSDVICGALAQDVCQFSVDANVPVTVSAVFDD